MLDLAKNRISSSFSHLLVPKLLHKASHGVVYLPTKNQPDLMSGTPRTFIPN